MANKKLMITYIYSYREDKFLGIILAIAPPQKTEDPPHKNEEFTLFHFFLLKILKYSRNIVQKRSLPGQRHPSAILQSRSNEGIRKIIDFPTKHKGLIFEYYSKIEPKLNYLDPEFSQKTSHKLLLQN